MIIIRLDSSFVFWTPAVPLNRSTTLIWSIECMEGESPNQSFSNQDDEVYSRLSLESHLRERRISDHRWQRTVSKSQTYPWSRSRRGKSHISAHILYRNHTSIRRIRWCANCEWKGAGAKKTNLSYCSWFVVSSDQLNSVRIPQLEAC